MKAAFKADGIRLYQGDCRIVIAGLKDNSIDAIVTDPPYELGFMGKTWDASGIAYNADVWAQALRVLKPGGHLISFGGTRTYHRLAVAIEDAGFEIRDSLMWLFGSGFPKSLDVSKALDKAAGAEREVQSERPAFGIGGHFALGGHADGATYKTDAGPATDLARAWEGWGTALKPAYEPIVLARKPLQGTVAGNVARWGTGGLNIDATRIEGGPRPWREPIESDERTHQTLHTKSASPVADTERGRWPANVLLDAEAARLLDAMSGERHSAGVYKKGKGSWNGAATIDIDGVTGSQYEDSGGASRFFYTAKASREEREFGLKMLELKQPHELTGRKKESAGQNHPRASIQTGARRNTHPTVKPIDLMRWLVRLITPLNGVVLDPFMGSGSTGVAATLEHTRFVGIDLDYLDISRSRLEAAIKRRDLGEVQETLEGEVHYKGCRYPAMQCICDKIKVKRGK